MMRDAIINFSKQFEYEPVIQNGNNWGAYKRFIVAGMGGSHLGADLLKIIKPELGVLIHADYGIPPVPKSEIGSYACIVSSYSGATEEPLDTYDQARNAGMPLAAIATGGELLLRARKDNVPFVEIPVTGIQPRSATGFSMRALMKLMGEGSLLKESSSLAGILKPLAQEEDGKKLAKNLSGKVPVVYASNNNGPLAYNWKIKFNETGKIPAFYNVLPELNHNEMTGFDIKDATRALSARFGFIFLKDAGDHPRIRRRMEILEKLYTDRDMPVFSVDIRGESGFEKIFSTLILADWTAYYSAEYYGVESEAVPMVEEFKGLIQK